MENVQKPKVGAGIKTISILQLIGSVFGLWSIRNFFNKEKLNAANKATGELLNMVVPEVTNLSITIGLVFSIILGISVILILKKKELGIYIYFTTIVANIAYTIVTAGFSPWSLVALIMPALMGFFIWKKKEIFSSETKSEQIDI